MSWCLVHITAALTQVSTIMSNLQDTATRQRARTILLWQQQSGHGVQSLGGGGQ